MAVALHHLQLPYPLGSEAHLRHFYKGLLGLTESPEPGSRTLRFSARGQRIDFVPTDSWSVAPGFYFALEVQDFTGLHQRLEAAGCSVYGRPPLAGRRRFWVTDPNGYTLEIIETESVLEFAV